MDAILVDCVFKQPGSPGSQGIAVRSRVASARRSERAYSTAWSRGRYPFQTLWSACHPATWSARSGPAEPQPLALWLARACDRVPGVRREQRRSGPGPGPTLQLPLAAACARPEADPDWLSGGPARPGDPRTPPSQPGPESTEQG